MRNLKMVKYTAAIALIIVAFMVSETEQNIHVPREVSLRSEIDNMIEAYESDEEINEPEEPEESIDAFLAGIDTALKPLDYVLKPVTVRDWFPFFFVYIEHTRTGVEVTFNNKPPGFSPEDLYIPIQELPDNGKILYQHISISNSISKETFLCDKGILTGSAVFYTEPIGSTGDYELFRDPQREQTLKDINSTDGIIIMEMEKNKLHVLIEGENDVIILNEYLLLKKRKCSDNTSNKCSDNTWNISSDIDESIDDPGDLLEELEKRDPKHILVIEIEEIKNDQEPEIPV